MFLEQNGILLLQLLEKKYFVTYHSSLSETQRISTALVELSFN